MALRGWRLIGACVLLLIALQCHAAQIKSVKAEAEVNPQQIELFAKYSVILNSDLEDALRNGLTLPFIYEFRLSKPRIYAWYRQVAEGFGPNAHLTLKLSYQPLTKQYRVTSSAVTRHFNSLEEALSALGQLKNWSVLENSNIDADDFAGRIRLRLDSSQLPKAYQLSNIGNANWQLESSWTDLQLRKPADVEATQ